jgi:hypothetical protein
MDERLKEGKVDLENVFDMLALVYNTGEVLAYRLIIALERLSDAVDSGKGEAVLKAISQLNELFEQFMKIYEEQIRDESYKNPDNFRKNTLYGFWIF